MKRFVRSGLLVGTMVFSVSVSTAQMFKPSKNDQLKAGQEYAARLRREAKILPDSDPRVKLLREVGNRLLATRTPDEIKREPWQFSFDVIDDKEVNAFALPGGPIFFFSGLLDQMQTVDELAGVMGHELIHVRREHWASSVNAQQERQAGILILGSIFGLSRRSMDIAMIVEQFGFDLPAGRGQERESDMHGFDSVVKAGYNPVGMVRVFEMFRRLKGNGAPPEFLSTHPDDKNRIANLNKRIGEFQVAGRLPKTLGALTPLPFQTSAMKAATAPPIQPAKGTGGKKLSSKMKVKNGAYHSFLSCCSGH
jgi:predicted Zn-dependent protease